MVLTHTHTHTCARGADDAVVDVGAAVDGDLQAVVGVVVLRRLIVWVKLRAEEQRSSDRRLEEPATEAAPPPRANPSAGITESSGWRTSSMSTQDITVICLLNSLVEQKGPNPDPSNERSPAMVDRPPTFPSCGSEPERGRTGSAKVADLP